MVLVAMAEAAAATKTLATTAMVGVTDNRQQSSKSGSRRNGGREGNSNGDNNDDGKDNDGGNDNSGDGGILARQTTNK